MKLLLLLFKLPPKVRIPGVKSKNVRNIKAGSSGYVSMSSSSGKVSWNKIALKRCTSMLTLWNRNWAFNGFPEWSVICGPFLPEKKPWCHLVARVTQLPLAETHEWRTLHCRPILSISYRQLVQPPAI